MGKIKKFVWHLLDQKISEDSKKKLHEIESEIIAKLVCKL